MAGSFKGKVSGETEGEVDVQAPSEKLPDRGKRKKTHAVMQRWKRPTLQLAELLSSISAQCILSISLCSMSKAIGLDVPNVHKIIFFFYFIES